MMAALLAGSLAATAGGFAYAKTDGQAFDPAKFQQRIEKRVDKALTGTDATADQKKKVTEILQAAFKDMKPLHAQRVENRKAMEAAMQAPTIDPAKIEQIRAEQMKIADAELQALHQGADRCRQRAERLAAPGLLQELERAPRQAPRLAAGRVTSRVAPARY